MAAGLALGPRDRVRCRRRRAWAYIPVWLAVTADRPNGTPTPPVPLAARLSKATGADRAGTGEDVANPSRPRIGPLQRAPGTPRGDGRRRPARHARHNLPNREHGRKVPAARRQLPRSVAWFLFSSEDICPTELVRIPHISPRRFARPALHERLRGVDAGGHDPGEPATGVSPCVTQPPRGTKGTRRNPQHPGRPTMDFADAIALPNDKDDQETARCDLRHTALAPVATAGRGVRSRTARRRRSSP